MSEPVFELVWQDIVARQFASANAVDKVRFPELSAAALNQTAEFAKLSIPVSGHELNIRRVSAYSMVQAWDKSSQP